MKRMITLVFIFLFAALVASSQVSDTSHNASSDLYKKYIKKNRINKTVGWILLGSGLIIAGGSYLAYANNGFNGVWEQEDLFNVGLVTAAVSIPCFIFAGINKRKAKLVLKGESIAFGKLMPGAQFNNTYYAAVSLRINL